MSDIDPDRQTTPGEWEKAAELAQNGNTVAAHDILREFVEAVALSSEQGWTGPIPWHCARYIADAFKQICDEGADPARALGLKQIKAGRPAGTKTHDEVRLAAAYWLLVRCEHSPEEANRLISEATGADRTTIQRAASACNAFGDAERVDEDLLVAIFSEQLTLANLIAELDQKHRLRK